MGLIINATSEKKILIQGTEIEIPSVYGRIEFAGRFNGVTMDIVMATYASEQAYTSGASMLSTTIPTKSITVELSNGQEQSITAALEYAKQAYENNGYLVTIIP